MSDELIIIGSGGHAKAVLEAIRVREPARRIVLLDDDPDSTNRYVLGVKVTGTRDWLAANAGDSAVALAIGDNAARLTLLDWLVAEGRRVETVVHPSAIVGATVEIGTGAFLAAGSITIADAKIGRGAILNTACSVDHDCIIGDGVHIGPGARLCGNVRVGARSLIGVGSAVRPGVTIGSDVVVGAGSAVVADIPDGAVYAGCPARPLEPSH
jgi:sugar O-acyltransferase (sialic acid O-acetyltransferase NeuD family)